MSGAVHTWRVPCLACLTVVACLFLQPGGASAQQVASRFTTGDRDLVSLTFGTSTATLSATLTVQSGAVHPVTMFGQPMLRVAERTSLLVHLPEVLPQNFTLEFDIVPKTCCMPEDLAVEGTRTINQGTTSANVLWHRDQIMVVGGASDNYHGKVPEALAASVPGNLTRIVLVVQGDNMTLLTNGQQLFSLTSRKFVRDNILRVFLGGQNDTDRAVYLARLRVIANATGPVVGTSPTGAQQTAILAPGATGTVVPAGTTGKPVGTAPAPRGVTVMGNGPAPTSLTVSGGPTTATLTWNAATGATSYRVNRAITGTTDWMPLTPTPITATSLANDPLPDHRQSYTYQVLAYQPGGQFGGASVDYTPPRPTDPTNLTATVSGTVIQLSWTGVPYVSGYMVWGPGLPNATEVTGATIQIPNLPAGFHTYRVASFYAPGGVLTPSSGWPVVVARVAPKPVLPFLALPNGPGSNSLTLLHYGLGAYCWDNGSMTSDCERVSVSGLSLGEVLARWRLIDTESERQEFFARIFRESVAFADTADLGFGRRIWCGGEVCIASSHGAAPGSQGFNDAARNGASAASGSNSSGFNAIVRGDFGKGPLQYHAFKFPPGYDPDAEPDPLKRFISQLNNASAVDASGIAGATFDTEGPKAAPHSCLACHGGRIDPNTGKISGGSLLPLDPARLVFLNQPGFSRADQENRIRSINHSIRWPSRQTPVPAMVVEYLDALYPNALARYSYSVTAPAVDDFVPSGWTSQPALWRTVIRPYCITCHMAQEGPLAFQSFNDLRLLRDRVHKSICTDGTMPHSELQFRRFWTAGGPVYLAGFLSTQLGFPSCP